MKLNELLLGIKVVNCTADLNTEVNHIRYDSRAVGTGDLFVAIRGYQTDGHKYIDKAISQGAVAVICEENIEGVPCIVTENSRIALAKVSSNYFGNPAKDMKMIGVTGTNGKTTTTYLVKHILEEQGYKVGLIGTNQNMVGEKIIETERTTPESYELHALFKEMLDSGCTHVIMEVSSHSLALDRVHDINFEVGAFTNLTQDHLDFHGTMEEYRVAKSEMFKISQKSVINLDDKAGIKMVQDATGKVITYSASIDNADIVAKNLDLKADGVDFVCASTQQIARVHLSIPGLFSVQNALCAIGIADALEITLEQSAKALLTATGVKGRAEVVKTPEGTPYVALIDYAHSPDGVENILKAVKGFSKGRVVAIFGCGGDRDKTKRPKMGKIAADLADFCVVTSDNPRTEQPEAIIEDILEGMKDTKTPIKTIVDRREAIVWVLDNAQPDDTLVFMGKGHETYQEIHHVKHHLDEREEIENYFANKNN